MANKKLKKELLLAQESISKQPINIKNNQIEKVQARNFAIRKLLAYTRSNKKSTNMHKSSRKPHPAPRCQLSGISSRPHNSAVTWWATLHRQAQLVLGTSPMSPGAILVAFNYWFFTKNAV